MVTAGAVHDPAHRPLAQDFAFRGNKAANRLLSFRDHGFGGAAIGVTDQDGGTVEAVEDQVGRGDVTRQRQGRAGWYAQLVGRVTPATLGFARPRSI
jgi:hypothetical protein